MFDFGYSFPELLWSALCLNLRLIWLKIVKGGGNVYDKVFLSSSIQFMYHFKKWSRVAKYV